MPSPRAVLHDIMTLGLDLNTPYRSTNKYGQIMSGHVKKEHVDVVIIKETITIAEPKNALVEIEQPKVVVTEDIKAVVEFQKETLSEKLDSVLETIISVEEIEQQKEEITNVVQEEVKEEVEVKKIRGKRGSRQ